MLITLKQLVTTSNGTILTFWRPARLTTIVRLKRPCLFRSCSQLQHRMSMSAVKSFYFIRKAFPLCHFTVSVWNVLTGRSHELFPVDRFFLNFYCSKITSYLCQKCRKKIGGHWLRSEIKCVENYPDFENLAHVIQHGLQGLIIRNIEGESTEANDLSRILWKWVCCVNNSKY